MRIATHLLRSAALLAAVFGIVSTAPVLARWKPQYAKASPEIQAWYKQQHNSEGQWCCDKSDGHPFYGAYTMNKDGSVTLDLKDGRRTLPKYMVLSGPNPTGHAVWWYLDVGNNHTDFCFAPGTLT